MVRRLGQTMNGSEDQPSPVNSQVYRDLFRDKYLLSQYAFVQFLVEHLTDVSRVFEADLQSVLVLAIVGQMGLQTAIRLGHPADGSTPLNFGADPTLRINASSIAEISGIPRRQSGENSKASRRRAGWRELQTGFGELQRMKNRLLRPDASFRTRAARDGAARALPRADSGAGYRDGPTKKVERRETLPNSPPIVSMGAKNQAQVFTSAWRGRFEQFCPFWAPCPFWVSKRMYYHRALLRF